MATSTLKVNPYVLPASAGNPQLSAMNTTKINSINQNSMVNTIGGKRKQKKRKQTLKKGGSSSIVVPTISNNGVKPLVPDVSSQSTVTKLTSLSVNNQNNALNDSKITSGGFFSCKSTKYKKSKSNKYKFKKSKSKKYKSKKSKK
jgi:hypothetical protein